MALREEEVRELLAMADESRGQVLPEMAARSPRRFDPAMVGTELRALASSIGTTQVGECPRCSPDPCACDHSPSGPGTESMLPENMRSNRPLTETRTWKEYVAMQRGGRKVGPRRRKAGGDEMNETALDLQEPPKKRRAGGLPAAPPPIEPEPAPEIEEPAPARQAGPSRQKGPTANEAFTAQKAYEEGEEPQDEGVDPLEYIQANFEGAPSSKQIEGWKRMHGDVFITGITDDEVFIWRSVRRLEYKNILSRVSTAMQAIARTQNALANVDEGRNSLFMEEICKTCVLWPEMDVDQLTFSKAGTLDTLCNLILEASNFVSHALAVRLTRKI